MSVEPQKKGDSAEHPVTGGSTGVIEGSGSGSSRKQRASKVELAAASPLQPGSLVAGRYRIERVLGVGGMGAVYEATQLNIGRKVALKVVRADYAGDPTMAKRFQREATAAASVHHPAVVMVHEFGQTDDGVLFLVMELLDGESLSQRLKRSGKLQPREAIRIACEVLSALEAAHDAGVVHRDLKPDNITLLSSGGVKVLDFGIARILDRGDTPAPTNDRAALTDVGQMLGTPRYMSPEAVARMPVGPAADLYALGAILFEMLAGRHVFTEKEPVILMGHHLRSQPPRLREVAPELEAPYAVDEIIDHLLRKMPTERPASAETVRKKLLMLDWSTLMADDHNRDKLFTKPPDEEVPREKFFQGNGPLFHAMRVVVVLLIGATIAWILYAHRQRLDEERLLRAQQVVATPVAPVETLHAPAIHQAHMRIEVLPATAEASITWDGEAMTGTEFEVTQDGAPHQMEISAPGFQTESVEMNADGPHTITIELDRAARAPRRRATPPPQ